MSKKFNSDKVRRILKEQKLTPSWLAKRCGVTVESFRNFMCSGSLPSLPVLKLISLYLDVPIKSLLKGDK